MTRKIIHVDMDAFYASVEQRDDPALRGRPVVVGGTPDGRGVVAAASYEARAFGVRSAMSASKARKLCPDAVFLRGDFGKYRRVSRQVFAIFHDTTELVEGLSLDEAYLDVTENKLGMDRASEIAKLVRARIKDELSLTASAGVAPLKFVAKIASDYRKPDGLTVVPPDRVLEFIHPLPIEKLWGVGPATAERLHRAGIRLVHDLAVLDAGQVRARLGDRGLHLWRMSRGEDPRRVRRREGRKSRGAERTFSEDIDDVELLGKRLRELAEGICDDMSARGERARTVVLKLRYADFTTITRSRTLPRPTNDGREVAQVAQALLADTDAGLRAVRLIGVSMSGFGGDETAHPLQLRLPFEP
ncbi:MAG: DNA polymerase IV [Deltaproteobacteria bacterium]|nr:MAG: DNA polymerase IV [Deltaproteobacteria bacterium]